MEVPPKTGLLFVGFSRNTGNACVFLQTDVDDPTGRRPGARHGSDLGIY